MQGIKNILNNSGLTTAEGRRLFVRKYWHAVFFLGYLVSAGTFSIIEKYNMPKYWMSCPLDQLIPFVPAFVIPYVLWFPWTAATLIVLFFKDRSGFIKTITLIYMGMLLSYVVFLLYPNGQTLRPIITSNDIFSRAVRFIIYANDTNTNCCPSIHVLNQTALHIGLCKSEFFRDKPKWKLVSLVMTIFICASTCFIKQHSVIDVTAALIIEFFLSKAFFSVNWNQVLSRFHPGSPDIQQNA